jgi:hypothetical protein
MSKTEISLDYESKSEVQLVGPASVGLWNYVKHPSTKPLMLAYAWNRGQVEHIDFTKGQKLPREVKEALLDPEVVKRAFNAQFERVLTKEVLQIDTPIKNWRCTMAQAYMRSFTGGLEDVGVQIGLDGDKLKNPTGKKLIRLFSMPQKITKNQPLLWRDRNTDPEQWEEFCKYCIQDVTSENEIANYLDRYAVPDEEWTLYEIDQEINDNGLPVNMQFVYNAMDMVGQRKRELFDMMQEITGLRNPNSGAQLLPWLQDRGYTFSDLQKNTIKKVLTENEKMIDPAAVAVMRLRQQASRTSVKKYDAIARRISDDRLLKFCFQFAGAQRTNRWSGRGPQPQNLVRTPKLLEANDGDFSLLESVTQCITDGDYELLQVLVAEPMTALAGLIRSSFQAPEGYEFVVCDLKAIESAVIAWLSGCSRMLRVFADGRDPYKDFATALYNIAYSLVTKEQRGISKPPTLGCFTADTLVLSERGWIAIADVTSEDRVHDGVEFVTTTGVIDQGRKEVIDLFGIGVTADHEVWTEEGWKQACRLVQDSRIGQKALRSAYGALEACGEIIKANDTTFAIVRNAVSSKMSTDTHSKQEKVSLVFHGPITNDGWMKGQFTNFFPSIERLSIGSPTDTTPFCRDVAALVNPLTDITVGESNVGSTAFMSSLGIASLLKDLTVSNLKSIGSITTDTMKKETFDSLTGLPTQGTQTRIENVYDLGNCGPRQRFVILTAEGPLIVHNCGFGLGGGILRDGKKTGLWGYAEGMGVNITQQEAAKQVEVFRSIYPEIPEFWKQLEDACFAAVNGKSTTINGLLRVDKRGEFMTIRLPSGRLMYYHKPKIEIKEFVGKNGKPYTKRVFTCMGKSQISGKWTRIISGGPKICENVVQATAREVLAHGMRAAHDFGFKLVGSVHDELIALRRKGDNYFTLEAMVECMVKDIWFTKGLPLAAEGYVAPIYMK